MDIYEIQTLFKGFFIEASRFQEQTSMVFFPLNPEAPSSDQEHTPTIGMDRRPTLQALAFR
jgi:hypothetical protein